MSELGNLGAEKYVLVTTFRKDGRAVPTPVWVVPDGDAIAVWTPAGSGKVKRIRRRADVTVAACDFRGTPHGDAFPARAAVLDDAGSDRVRAQIRKKYGLSGWLTVLGSAARRGRTGTVGIRITPAPGR